MPTTWDETRVPEAIPGQWASIARRKGDEWFVGTINNSQEKQVYLPLQFLPPGEYTATIYSDAPDDASMMPNHLTMETRALKHSDSLLLKLAGNGQVMMLRKTVADR